MTRRDFQGTGSVNAVCIKRVVSRRAIRTTLQEIFAGEVEDPLGAFSACAGRWEDVFVRCNTNTLHDVVSVVVLGCVEVLESRAWPGDGGFQRSE